MAQQGDDGSLWGAILEKAFSKFWGNYARTEGGWMEMAVRTMLGAPYFDFYNPNQSIDYLWSTLSTADNGFDIITAATPGGGNHDITWENGLAHSHAYTVVGVKELSNGVKLVKMRNPWGSEGYSGPWSDGSSEWTDELKAEVDLVQDTRDGFFYIDIQNFKDSFAWTTVSYDTEGWFHDEFLMLDDDMSTWEAAGWVRSERAAGHTIKITSETAQKIIVGVHTWDGRS